VLDFPFVMLNELIVNLQDREDANRNTDDHVGNPISPVSVAMSFVCWWHVSTDSDVCFHGSCGEAKPTWDRRCLTIGGDP
jgi:hypothetical protein